MFKEKISYNTCVKSITKKPYFAGRKLLDLDLRDHLRYMREEYNRSVVSDLFLLGVRVIFFVLFLMYNMRYSKVLLKENYAYFAGAMLWEIRNKTQGHRKYREDIIEMMYVKSICIFFLNVGC